MISVNHLATKWHHLKCADRWNFDVVDFCFTFFSNILVVLFCFSSSSVHLYNIV